jgi:hypothetical protein
VTETFSNRFLKKTVTVDDDGIYLRRVDSLITFVRWDEIKRIDGVVRCENGTKVRLPLTKQQYQKFFKCASEIWRQRNPEKWQRNRDRIARRTNWVIYFWYPMFFIVPFVFWHLWFFLRGSPNYFRPQMQKIDRVTMLGLIASVGLMIWLNLSRRREAKNEQNQSKITR